MGLNQLTEGQIVSLARFEIMRCRKAAAANSIMADYHKMESEVLSKLLEAYERLNDLERESLKQKGMPLADLIREKHEQPLFRAKHVRR